MSAELDTLSLLSRRVLVVMPSPRDAERTLSLLREHGISSTVCAELDVLSRELERGAGALLLTDEIIAGEPWRQLASVLREQPPWSRVPVVLVAHEGAEQIRAWATESLRSPIVVERPVRTRTLLSVLRSALLTREDQYQIGDALSALERSKQELAEQAEALRTTDRRKDEFLATLAHELRNPLAPIQTGLDILSHARHDEAGERALGVMNRQLQHMVRLIDDLLDVSRITQGKLELKRARVTLEEVLDTAVETSRPLIERGHHALRVTVADPNVAFDADATRLAQVVSNLLNNAAKYSPAGGLIELSAQREGNQCLIEVRDDGIGIPADQLDDVFHMFSQVNRALSRSQGGMGIGLALARSLTELHGGTITGESRGLGLGSTFRVRLPVATRTERKPPVPVADAIVRHDRKRVLVVDDNHDAADMLAIMLEHADYESRQAHDGKSALAAALAWGPDIVILDIGLPDVSGYEVARQLREDPRFQKLELIALSGWGTEDDKRKAVAAGFNRHFTKPVDAGALCAALARASER
ncbi:MAG TPA: ATP-binding protein [Polyangiaceae bacterium]|nr:ATP-binding protein [Polyangiaceae bacterium]